MEIVNTKAALREALRTRRNDTIGFAPTMGFLHAGHVSLFEAAARDNATAVASIFVNPTQFGENEDLDTYPRDPEGDAQKCRDAGIDLLWMPSTDAVYADDHATTVTVKGLTGGLCGASRPGHFDGVTTVVAKLLNLVQPTRAYFGQKDFQQLAVIRRMVRDLDMPVEIVGMPIVREADGLAMSSRNSYLSAEQRADALGLQRAIGATRAVYENGERDPATLRTTLHAALAAEPNIRVDYAVVVDADTLEPPVDGAPVTRPVLVALAAWVGATRLIDNTVLA